MGRQSWKRADLVAAANLHSLHRADDEEVELPNRAKRTLQHLRRARAEWHVARLAVLGIEHDDLVAARVGLRARSPPRGGRTLGERSRVQGQSTEFPHQLGAVGAQIIQHKRRRRTERERCWERYPRHNIRVFRNLRRPRQILVQSDSLRSALATRPFAPLCANSSPAWTQSDGSKHNFSPRSTRHVEEPRRNSTFRQSWFGHEELSRQSTSGFKTSPASFCLGSLERSQVCPLRVGCSRVHPNAFETMRRRRARRASVDDVLLRTAHRGCPVSPRFLAQRPRSVIWRA